MSQSDATSREATVEDVRFSYRLFLMRPPESSYVLQTKVGIPLSALIFSFLESEEFKVRMVDMVGNSDWLGAELVAPDLVRWVEDLSSDMLPGTASLAALILAVLGMPAVLALLEKSKLTWSISDFRKRLSNVNSMREELLHRDPTGTVVDFQATAKREWSRLFRLRRMLDAASNYQEQQDDVFCVLLNKASRRDAIRGLLDRGRSDVVLRHILGNPQLGNLDSQTAIIIADLLRNHGEDASAERLLRHAILADVGNLSIYVCLAELQLERGDRACATETIILAREANSPESRMEARRGRLVWTLLSPAEAIIAYRRAFDAGLRDVGFVIDFGWLLLGEQRYALVPLLAVDAQVQQDAQLFRFMTMLAAYARLAMTVDQSALQTSALMREASPRWVGSDNLGAFLKERIAAAQPYCWIRIGHGEARFITYMTQSMDRILTPNERLEIGRNVWNNWFHSDIADWNAGDVESIWDQLIGAFEHSDLLGVTSSESFVTDTANMGCTAVADQFTRQLEGGRPDLHFTPALANYALARSDPFFSETLSGLDFLGVISPHVSLAEALKVQHNICEVVGYVIPGELISTSHGNTEVANAHYPETFRKLLRSIHVPFTGAVFLVAGGILGKIYCARIKQLGGIAFDVGAVVDGWMGINTSPTHFDNTPVLIAVGQNNV